MHTHTQDGQKHAALMHSEKQERGTMQVIWQTVKRSVFSPMSGLLTAGLLAGMTFSTPAHAQLRCGDIVGPREKVVVRQNLPICDDSTGGITVVGPATLDLGGHTVTCLDLNGNGTVPVGIRMVGDRAKVKNGNVTGCSTGVVLDGNGRHRLERVNTGSNAAGITIFSDRNVVRKTLARDNTFSGYFVQGDRNNLQHNRADGNTGNGFNVFGNQNRLTKNVSVGSKQPGSQLSGSGFNIAVGERNILTRNTALLNDRHGFKLSITSKNKLLQNEAEQNGMSGITTRTSTAQNTLMRNTAVQNNRRNISGEFDLTDLMPNCGSNKWRRNGFVTSSQDCIE